MGCTAVLTLSMYLLYANTSATGLPLAQQLQIICQYMVEIAVHCKRHSNYRIVDNHW